MTRYCVWTIAREGYPHSRAFDELALSLANSIEELGHDIYMYPGDNPVRAQRGTWGSGERYRPIVLGAHLAPSWGIEIPDSAIIYNTEQRGSSWITPEYQELLAKHKVWDVFHGVRPGYHQCLEQIDRTGPRPIDVAFVGSMNERRHGILNTMRVMGLNVEHRFNCYGADRDNLYSRCKLALNIHYYEHAEHESVRTSYLAANRIPVLTEHSAWPHSSAPKWCQCASYANLAIAAKSIIDSGNLEEIAKHGYDAIRRMPMVLEVDKAL